VKQEIDEELRFHIEQRTAENITKGMTPEEAAREARKRFGNLQGIREELRDVRGANFGETVLQDVRFGLRMLRKNPGFTAVAVLTLALGIGANTAIFSVISAVLLKPLPYHDPGRIVMFWTDNQALNLGWHDLPPEAVDLPEWRGQAGSFEEIAGMQARTADLSGQDDPERVGGVAVTANFFSLLGVQPVLGRAFFSGEDQPGQDKIAIISHGLWQRRFGGDTNVPGRIVTINGERRSIVGVMPPGFNFPTGAEMPAGYGLLPQTDVWLPFAAGPDYWHHDENHIERDYLAMGRIRAGVRVAQAQAEMDAIAQHQAQEHPASHKGWTVHLSPLPTQVTGKTRPLLRVLAGAVTFILLIACANLASLLLCRSAARHKEILVRVAVGAGRGRILRQLLTESILLSALGGAIGLLVGTWIIKAILLFSPPGIPRLAETTLDGHVLLFTMSLSLVAGVVFGLGPAWQASKIDLTAALNSESRAATRMPRSLASLVMVEVALAIMLLTGAGLMIRSFARLHAVDPGFDLHRVAAFDIAFPEGEQGMPPNTNLFFREACERLAQVPGMRSAAVISHLPLSGGESVDGLIIEGAPPPSPGDFAATEGRVVSPGYFETMGVALLHGRDFTTEDTAGKPIVCIVNETLARTFFPGTNPLGKRVRLGQGTPDEANNPFWTIVGVARDVRGLALEIRPRPEVYLPVEQASSQREMTFVLRSAVVPADSLEKACRAELKALDPTLPLANFRTMERVVSNAMARPRFSALLLGIFAGTALLLAICGLYGVVTYGANRRTREIGIRIALGASRRGILALVIRQGMLPALMGMALGMAGATALSRFLAGQLYEVKPTDPATFFIVAVALLLVALLACYFPARRATRIDPMAALRCE